jgi:hypothetical protein
MLYVARKIPLENYKFIFSEISHGANIKECFPQKSIKSNNEVIFEGIKIKIKKRKKSRENDG